MEYKDYLFVPKERIGVLIGEKGKIKRLIEKRTGTKLMINSENGNVDVKRMEDTDPVMALKARDVVNAISLGFSPEQAIKLLSEGMALEVVDLEEYVGSSSKALQRQKARIIGTNGKARKNFEKLTQTDIVVYEHEVGIIGFQEDANIAFNAIEMIARGVPHGDVYHYIQTKARQSMGF